MHIQIKILLLLIVLLINYLSHLYLKHFLVIKKIFEHLLNKKSENYTSN